jgi:hypothetical protein
MAAYDRAERTKGAGVATGLLISAAVHAALVAGAILLHQQAEAEPDLSFKNIIEAKLVRLGTPLPENALPRLAAAPPPPPPEVGTKVTAQETPVPQTQEPPKEKPRRREEDPEAALRRALAAASDRTAPTRRGVPGGGKVGGEGPVAGDPRGDPEGEVASARDQIEGNLWAGQVRRVLHRAWAIPEVIPDTELNRLSAVVVIRIDEDGNIRSWRMKEPARGSSFASLYNGSVNQVQNKVRSLPPPPPGALKVFKGGWLALRFTKAEQERSR